MKIVLDMNLSPEWAGFLISNGIDAVHWSSEGKAPIRFFPKMWFLGQGTTSKNTSPLRRSLGFQERIDHCEHSVFLSMIEILA